jgi:hypothetical protein
MRRLPIVALALLWAQAALAYDGEAAKKLAEEQGKILQQLSKDFPLKLNEVNTTSVGKSDYQRPPNPPMGLKIVIENDLGGRIWDYERKWFAIAAKGGPVDIIGPCESACTLVMAHIPKERICFGPNASLAFHQARDDSSPAPKATREMFESYPMEIRGWLVAKGGWKDCPWRPTGY